MTNTSSKFTLNVIKWGELTQSDVRPKYFIQINLVNLRIGKKTSLYSFLSQVVIHHERINIRDNVNGSINGNETSAILLLHCHLARRSWKSLAFIVPRRGKKGSSKW